MTSWSLLRSVLFIAAFGLAICMAQVAAAQPTVTGPSDASRVRPQTDLGDLKYQEAPEVARPEQPKVEIPPGARKVKLTIKSVRVEGVTAFTPEEINVITAPYVGQKTDLGAVYEIAQKVSNLYHDAGYFLSRAYVPAQQIAGGNIVIKVVEGYVGKVDILGEKRVPRVVRSYVKKLLHARPLRMEDIESILLRVNDLPGYAGSGTLSPMNAKDEGAVLMTLTLQRKKDGAGSLGFDNMSSRYLGPNEVSAAYAKSFAPLQQTTVSTMTGLPSEKLRYVAANHQFVIAPALTAEIGVSLTKSQPGYILNPFHVLSDSASINVSLTYQMIRQRLKNLSLRLALDGKNSASDISGAPLTRDHVRVVRASMTYDFYDSWRGYTTTSLTLSHGLNSFGASKRGYLYLSRAEAVPDFTKLEFSFSRLQSLGSEWSLLLSASGQQSSSPLFSSEEYGYGGQAFGRAYDSSEITGDHGISGGIELRFDGWAGLSPVSLNPYAFYDVGAVWNEDVAQSNATGASAGVGMRFATQANQSGNIALAWPLTRPAGTPIYGQGKNGPRIILQISQRF